MGARYLVDLADVCRSAGLDVVEMEGWQSRARGSGGFNSGKPDHLCVHHTASPPSSDGWPDAEYCTHGDEDAPLCSLYMNRAGTVWVCAAGGTNTNGSGDCPHLEPDTMNSSAIGIEAGNNGTGEAWPPTQQDAYIALCSALCDAYGIPAAHVHSHAEWAPSRKIDPAGPSRWATSGTWNMDAFRGEIGDDDMATPDEVQYAVWHQTAPNKITGSPDEMWALVTAAHAEAYEAKQAVIRLWDALVAAGVIS